MRSKGLRNDGMTTKWDNMLSPSPMTMSLDSNDMVIQQDIWQEAPVKYPRL